MKRKNKTTTALAKAPVGLSKDVRDEIRGLIPKQIAEDYSAFISDCRREGNPKLYKCTPQTVEQMLGLLAIGHTIKNAASQCMISEKTWGEWRHKYPALRIVAARASGVMQTKIESTVAQGALVDPKLGLSWLERRDPSNWAPKKDIRISADVQHTGFNVGELHMLQAARHEQDIIDAEVIEPEQLPTSVDETSTSKPLETKEIVNDE